MRKFLFAALAASFGGAVVAADVILAEDAVPFTVHQDDVVRIAVPGIAGTTVGVKVTGNAKQTTNKLSTRVDGKRPVGPGNMEVEVRPTGKGEVKVEVAVSPPNGPSTTKFYTFTVE